MAQLCDQPFAPVRPNWEWQYRIQGTNPTTYTIRKTNITDSSFVQVRLSAGSKEEQKIGCSAQGLTPLELGGGGQRSGIGGQPLSYDLDIMSVKGVAIPDFDRWEVGSSWKLVQEIKGMGQQGPIRYNVSGSLETTYTIVAQEVVTVPAGKFTAYKVQTQFSTHLKATAGIVSIPINIDAQGTQWYAENVGLIKSIQQGRDSSNTTELVALKR